VAGDVGEVFADIGFVLASLANRCWHTRYDVTAAVYGHLHIPRTTEHDGVRFEEVSVGYPREWQRRGAAPPPPRVIFGPEPG
jgi:hypothetical protein